MRRLRISKSIVERRFRDAWQYRILLKRSEIQSLVINLLGLLYGLVDEIEVSGAKPPMIRVKYDEFALSSASIIPNNIYWIIGLSRMELEVWLKFLIASLLNMPSIDHIDLINEDPERDLHFTLAIDGEIEAVDAIEARKRLKG